MRVASARSPRCSRVMSDCLASTRDRGPVGGRPGEVGGGDLQQVCVPVVHDPVLRPGQQRREPAAHRAGAAAEVVDHPAAGCRELSPEVLDEVARTGRGVGRLAEGKPSPADPGALERSSRRPGQDTREDGRGGRPSGERLAPLAGGPAQPRSELGVAEPGPERGAERRRVLRRDQQPRPDPVGAVTEGLRHPADLGRDDRQAAGQSLGDDHAVRLGARRQHQQVRGGVAAVEIGSGPRSREAHAVAQPAVQ